MGKANGASQCWSDNQGVQFGPTSAVHALLSLMVVHFSRMQVSGFPQTPTSNEMVCVMQAGGLTLSQTLNVKSNVLPPYTLKSTESHSKRIPIVSDGDPSPSIEAEKPVGVTSGSSIISQVRVWSNSGAPKYTCWTKQENPGHG